MISGLVDLPWWGYVLVTLMLTHITIASITIYLHRHQAHRALELHPLASHFFRLWLWLTTGMITKEWTAIHRKHHAKCETLDDPHSPQILGIGRLLKEGSELYRKEAKNLETLTRYGHGTPDDWLERNIYSKHSAKGVTLTLIIDLILFGPIGLTIWAIQMIWSPIMAAGIVNGVGHYWGIATSKQRMLAAISFHGASSLEEKNCITTIMLTLPLHDYLINGMNSILAGCTYAFLS